MRAFLDANVLFSAVLVDRGNAPLLADLVRAQRFDGITTAYVLGETRRNLMRKAPAAVSRFDTFAPLLELAADAGDDLISWAGSCGLPRKDTPVLAAAAGAGADLLITGDERHFGHLFGQTLRGVLVLSLKDGLVAVLAAAERSAPPPRHG